jgi:hypothetical protein
VRIISDFHDYYDCLQTHDNLIFQRKTEKIKNIYYDYSFMDRYGDVGHLVGDLSLSLIGFCGKIYPFIYKITRETQDGIFYEYDDKILESIDIKKDKRRYFFGRRPEQKITVLKSVFDKKYSKYESVFDKHKTAIFRVTRDYITINPNLSELMFYRKFPTNLAFQELEMYLGSVLCANEDNIPTISNKDMIQAKGFDLKTSFRKGKSH